MRRVLVAALATLAFPAQALAGEQTLVLQSAPITLKPFEVQQSIQLVPSPQADGYVTGMSADVVDSSGAVEPPTHVMLHHVVFARAPGRDYTCASLGAERFYAEGEEHARLALPPGYGYENRGSDRWGLLYMLMNHHGMSETVSVRYTVRYVTGEQLTPVKPIWLDVRDCTSSSQFTVPGTGGRGAIWQEPWTFTMPESGYLVGGGAHLHGGGIKLALEDVTCAAGLFTSWPTWSTGPMPLPVMHEPGPAHMTGFATRAGLPVAAGDTLRLTATYDNARPHVRAMGIMMVYLAPAPVFGCQAVPPLPPDPADHPAPPPVIKLPLLKQPSGTVSRSASTWVGDYRYGAQRVELRRGTTYTWRFIGAVAHDVTLATGPVGIASPETARGTWSFRFTRPGMYSFFCSLHPTRMTQRIVVR